ncbi:uncharacterized protein LOC121372220 isoform X2 [Gigantopelta aegis]|uniref:uncharacterized protein LOC121372220 isoform X2 n=1 Tax=Gigantopelta aegis TaxID=1735272 RepID=UPI001B8895A6|nr:uncharacterized protein LOC121372220 isoform X2 [Gigantopelta aegis]
MFKVKMEFDVIPMRITDLSLNMDTDSHFLSHQRPLSPLKEDESPATTTRTDRQKNIHMDSIVLTPRMGIMNPLQEIMNMRVNPVTISLSNDSGYVKSEFSHADSHADSMISVEKRLLQIQNKDIQLPKLNLNEDGNISMRDKSKKCSQRLRHLKRRSLEPEDPDFNVNPDPVPFLPQNFMSSTILKKISVPKRHMDTFGGIEYNLTNTKGVILHTDRYQWDTVRPFDGMSQRDRLLAELNYMEKLRGSRRRHEVVPHRAQLNLVMGGKKIEMEERFDIQREVNKLKALVLPRHARDLYLGRGIHLPLNHASIKPRGSLSVLDSDSDDYETMSAPHMYRSQLLDLHSMKRQSSQHPYSTGSSLNPRRVVPGINERYDTGLKHDMTKASKVHSVDGSRDPSVWVADQNQIMNEQNLTRVDSKDRVEIHMPDNKQKQPTNGGPERKLKTDTEKTKASLEKHTPVAPPTTAVEPTRTSTSPLYSRQGSSPVKPVNLHPLKGSELVTSVPENEKDELRQTFERLDTDMDGHLKFSQLKSQLPDALSQNQERFLKEVYEITSTSSTMFGVDEFLTMSQLTKMVENLRGEAQDAYQNLEFDTLEKEIQKFVELFQSVDRTNRGKISIDSLHEVLSTVLEKDFKDDEWQKILNTISLENNSQVSKIEFLAHLPYFLASKEKV